MGGQFSETDGFTNLLCSVWWDYHQQVQHGVCLAACSVFCVAHHILAPSALAEERGCSNIVFFKPLTYLLIRKAVVFRQLNN